MEKKIIQIYGGLRRDLPNNISLFLYKRMFNTILCIGKTDNIYVFDDQYWYMNYEDAVRIFETWDGINEPDGWFLHPSNW